MGCQQLSLQALDTGSWILLGPCTPDEVGVVWVGNTGEKRTDHSSFSLWPTQSGAPGAKRPLALGDSWGMCREAHLGVL